MEKEFEQYFDSLLNREQYQTTIEKKDKCFQAILIMEGWWQHMREIRECRSWYLQNSKDRDTIRFYDEEIRYCQREMASQLGRLIHE